MTSDDTKTCDCLKRLRASAESALQRGNPMIHTALMRGADELDMNDDDRARVQVVSGCDVTGLMMCDALMFMRITAFEDTLKLNADDDTFTLQLDLALAVLRSAAKAGQLDRARVFDLIGIAETAAR